MPRTAAIPHLSRTEQRASAKASRSRSDGRPALSIDDSGIYIGKSKWTVYRLIRTGELRAIRVGERGTLRVRPSDLDDYLDRNIVS